jgi:hypothetical protein
MNTTDIRDMPHSQSVFWIAAVPMTSIVIAAALVYGYKWDEITRIVSRWYSAKRGKSALDDTAPFLHGYGRNSRKDTFGTQASGGIAKDRNVFVSQFTGAMRQRKKKGGQGIVRRHTRESLF